MGQLSTRLAPQTAPPIASTNISIYLYDIWGFSLSVTFYIPPAPADRSRAQEGG